MADYYADSSFLVSVFRADANTEAANRFMAQTVPVIAYSPFNRIEVRNALRNAEAVGEIARADRAAAFQQLDADLRAEILVHTPVSWTEVFRRAEELSEKHAGENGQRTVDLLHVAIALECGAQTFLSFDLRQRKLAKAAGLKVKP